MRDNTHNLYLLIHFLSEFATQSYFKSVLDTASLLSSDVQTAFLSVNIFSEVLIPTPVPPHIRLPEYYTPEHSRTPTHKFAEYPIRIDSTTTYEPKNDPCFPVRIECFNTTNDSLSNKRKEAELKRLQTSNPELKFEVKVKFQGSNPHPVFQVSQIEHKTTPAPFEVTHIEFDRCPPDLRYGKIVFYNPYSGPKYTTSF